MSPSHGGVGPACLGRSVFEESGPVLFIPTQRGPWLTEVTQQKLRHNDGELYTILHHRGVKTWEEVIF